MRKVTCKCASNVTTTNQDVSVKLQLPHYWPLIIIAAFYALLSTIVSPAGDFPLNDDWGYGEPVRIFLTTGQLQLPASLAAGFTHVALGVAVCKVFGFSYVVLRCLTLSIGLAGSIALYYVVRELGVHRGASLFAVLIYAANPLIVNVEFSYMSDMLALGLTNLYFLFLLRAVRRNSLSYLLYAAFMLLLAIATRQSTVIFALCAIPVLMSCFHRFLPSLVIFIALIVLPLTAYAGVDLWLLHRREIANYYAPIRAQHALLLKELFASPISSWTQMVVALGQVSSYLGLFCIPMMCPLVTRFSRVWWHKVKTALVWIVLAGNAIAFSMWNLVVLNKRLMPFDQNLLRIPSVGAHGIMGVSIPLMKPALRQVLTGGCAVLAVLLLSVFGAGTERACHVILRSFQALFNAPDKYLGSRMCRRASVVAICFLAAILSLSFVTLETVVRCTDRYYLMALAPALMCLSLTFRWLYTNPVKVVSITLLAILAIYSTLAAQDYLSWNRARWRALERLESSGVKASEIDGGAEYNYVKDMLLYQGNNMGAPPRNKWRWWQISSEDYIVSFSGLPEYEVIDKECYFSALTFSGKEVLVLKHVQMKNQGIK